MSVASTTELLQKVAMGDKNAESDLLRDIYRELHKMAHARLRGERPEHTLQPTALVNEAYIRLISQKNADWKNRTHFFSAAAKTMRRILVDYARQRAAEKRGPGMQVSLVSDFAISPDQPDLVADLDDALTHLEKLSERAARVVELKYFGGMTEDEIAEALSVNARTVKRDWKMARAWLYGYLSPK